MVCAVPLFLEEREVGDGLFFVLEERVGSWEMYGYHIRSDPWNDERYS